jgi:hypothetical protein
MYYQLTRTSSTNLLFYLSIQMDGALERSVDIFSRICFFWKKMQQIQKK